MLYQVFFVSPHLLEHEDVILLYVVVDMTAETARVNLALLSRPSEDFQCPIALFGRYDHPDGCKNHKLVSLLALTQDPRLRVEGFLDKKELVSYRAKSTVIRRFPACMLNT
jgi:hypothetical protein